MRRFTDLDQALACADIGGQALFITGWIGEGGRRKDTAAHLFDADADRLQKTAMRLQEESEILTAAQWRPGWLVYYIPIAGVAVDNALKRCHSRIVRRTIGGNNAAADV